MPACSSCKTSSGGAWHRQQRNEGQIGSLDKLELLGQLARVLACHVEVAASPRDEAAASETLQRLQGSSSACRRRRQAAAAGGGGPAAAHPVPAVLSSFTRTVAAFLPPAIVRLECAGSGAVAGRLEGAAFGLERCGCTCDTSALCQGSRSGFGSSVSLLGLLRPRICPLSACSRLGRSHIAAEQTYQHLYYGWQRLFRARRRAVPHFALRSVAGSLQLRSRCLGDHHVAGLQLGAAHAGQGARRPPAAAAAAAAAASPLAASLLLIWFGYWIEYGAGSAEDHAGRSGH